MVNRKYYHKDVLKIFPDIKPRSLIHWAEIGLITPSEEPGNRGGKRGYSYSNLITIGLIRQLLMHGLDIREARDIILHEEVQDKLKIGNYEWLFHIELGLLLAIDRKDGKPFDLINALVNWEICDVGEYKPNIDVTASGLFVNVAYIKRFVDDALKNYVA